MTIEKVFAFKDNIKRIANRSSIVYKLKCQSCNATYIGFTAQILEYRVKEHHNDSSACRQHVINNPGHVFGYDQVEVIDTGDSILKLRIKELLHILKEKPVLNRQLGTQSKYEVKTILILTYAQFKSGEEQEIEEDR